MHNMNLPNNTPCFESNKVIEQTKRIVVSWFSSHSPAASFDSHTMDYEVIAEIEKNLKKGLTTNV